MLPYRRRLNRQRLPFRLKPRDHLPAVHAQLNDLEGHAAAHRFVLFGDVDGAATALTHFLEQLVTADPIAGLFTQEFVVERGNRAGRLRKERGGMFVGGKKAA